MIGCGAIAACYHLPGLATIPGVMQNVVLVDRSTERKQLMADQFGIRQQATDLAEIMDRDRWRDRGSAAVIAPFDLHATVVA